LGAVELITDDDDFDDDDDYYYYLLFKCLHLISGCGTPYLHA